MKKTVCYLLTFIMYLSIQSCSEDVYKYPKVRKELVDVVLFNDGVIDKVITSNNKEYIPKQGGKFSLNSTTTGTNVMRGISQLEFSEDMSVLYRMYNFIQIPVLVPEFTSITDKDPIGKVERCWFTNNRYINLEIKYPSLDATRHKFRVAAKLDNNFLDTETLHLELIHKSSEKNETVGSYDALILSIDLDEYMENSAIKDVVLTTMIEGNSTPQIIEVSNFKNI